jgi:hypothetical protein
VLLAVLALLELKFNDGSTRPNTKKEKRWEDAVSYIHKSTNTGLRRHLWQDHSALVAKLGVGGVDVHAAKPTIWRLVACSKGEGFTSEFASN